MEVDVDPALMTPTSPIPNLARVDRYTVITNGLVVTPWLLLPSIANGRLVVVGVGHTVTGNLNFYGTALVSAAVGQGATVLLIPMPNGGVGHDALGQQGTPSFHPMQWFLDPAVVALNQYLATHPTPVSIGATGISGGGWTMVLLAALDLRVQWSVPIAGSLPLNLREAGTPEYGDWEQRLPNLTWNGSTPLDYLDLYLMAVSNGRTQIQVNNDTDPCCFAGTRHTSYAFVLMETVPRWIFVQDHLPAHGVSGAVLATILGPLLGAP